MKIEISKPGDKQRSTDSSGSDNQSVTAKPTVDLEAKLDGDKADASAPNGGVETSSRPIEHGGPSGPEPTRYGDWERNGRCTDF